MFRDEKISESVKKLAAEFLQKESGPSSLITVTNATFNEKSNMAHIFFTVLPEQKESDALLFAKRKRSEFRDYVRLKLKMRLAPFFDFVIDTGEKNRQKLDSI